MIFKEENTIEELKKELDYYKDRFYDLTDTMDQLEISQPYECGNCNKYMKVVDYDEFRNETFDSESNTWDSQRCDCCPMCAKADMLNEDEIVIMTKHVLEENGMPCAKCMEEYDEIINRRIEEIIIEKAALECWQWDDALLVHYANADDLDENANNFLEKASSERLSWANKSPWVELAAYGESY